MIMDTYKFLQDKIKVHNLRTSLRRNLRKFTLIKPLRVNLIIGFYDLLYSLLHSSKEMLVKLWLR